MNELAHEDWRRWWRRDGEAAVRRLLVARWDPIGVADVPEAADEYDSYVLRLGGQLRQGARVEELAAYLSSVRTESMGLDPDPAADLAVAQRLLEWYDAATTSEPGT